MAGCGCVTVAVGCHLGSQLGSPPGHSTNPLECSRPAGASNRAAARECPGARCLQPEAVDDVGRTPVPPEGVQGSVPIACTHRPVPPLAVWRPRSAAVRLVPGDTS
jgi:hypothetical protein